jgi:hypothetical protein
MATLDARLIQSLGWLAVRIRRTAMPRTHQPSQAVLGSVLTRHRGPEDTSDAGVFYVGLGDRFDDDRRLVREAASELRPAMHPDLGWRLLSSYLRR